MENPSDQQFLRTQFLNLLTPLNQEQVHKIVQYLKIRCSGRTGPQYRLLRMAQIALYLQQLSHSLNQKNYVCIQSVTCQLQHSQAQAVIGQIGNILHNSPQGFYQPSIMFKVQKLQILYKYINQVKYLCLLIFDKMQFSMPHKQLITKNIIGIIICYASRTEACIYKNNSQFIKTTFLVFSVIFEFNYGQEIEQMKQKFNHVFCQSSQFNDWPQQSKKFHEYFLEIVNKPKHYSKEISDLTFIKKQCDCNSFYSIIISQLNDIGANSHISEPEQWRVISKIRLTEDHQKPKHHQFKSPPIVHPSKQKVFEASGIIIQMLELQKDEFQ